MLNLFPRDFTYDALLAEIDDRTERVVIEDEVDYFEVFEASAAHGLLTLDHITDEDHEPGQRSMIVVPVGHAEAIAAAILRAAGRSRQ